MTIELVASPRIISKAKNRTDCFFKKKSFSYHKRNNVISFYDAPLVLSFSKNVLTILVEPTDSLLQVVLFYIKEVFQSKKPIGIRVSQHELVPLFYGLNCVEI